MRRAEPVPQRDDVAVGRAELEPEPGPAEPIGLPPVQLPGNDLPGDGLPGDRAEPTEHQEIELSLGREPDELQQNDHAGAAEQRRDVALGHVEQSSLVASAPGPLAIPAELAERAVEYAENADAPATRRAYGTQWRRFSEWCRARGLSPLPAEPATLALFLTDLADGGSGLSTLEQTISAIAQRHERAELAPPHKVPAVKRVWRGIRRRLGRARRRASPVSPEILRRLIGATPETRGGARDKAIFLVGFCGAFRRHEIVDLDVPDVVFTDEGLLVTIRRSKGDQEGAGAVVAVPRGSDETTCPVRALRAWLDVSGIEEGPIFRAVRRGGRVSAKRLDGRDVARILQRAAARAGVNLERLSGHSLRSGLGTTAAKQGKRLEVIQRHMRHKRLDQTVEYVRAATAFDEDENAASGIGL